MAEFETCRDPNCSWAYTLDGRPRRRNPHAHPVTPGRRGSLGDIGQFQPRLVVTRPIGDAVTIPAAALHSLRVEFAEWQLREFPLFGFDALHQMAARGLCTQEQADAAVAEAQRRIDHEDGSAPFELKGPPIKHPWED